MLLNRGCIYTRIGSTFALQGADDLMLVPKSAFLHRADSGAFLSRERKTYSRAFLAFAFAVMVLAGCGAPQKDGVLQNVTIASVIPSYSAHPLQQGTKAQLSIDNFYGRVSLADTTIVFTSNGSVAGNAPITAEQPAFGLVEGGTIVLSFTIPQFSSTAPGQFGIAVSGKTTAGGAIATPSPFLATIVPPASVTSITPATVHAGQQAVVTIQGEYANFAQGVTIASFGPGISVGGGTSGAAGPVTVSGDNLATASISVDPTAATGQRTVSITTNDQIAAASNAMTVAAALVPPVANAGGPYSGFATQSITFTSAGSSDPNGLALTYAWDFGDGATSSTQSPSHAYSKAGTFAVKLTVSDSGGLATSATTTATIAALAAPVPSIGGPYAGQTGQSISFDASASTDPNKSVLTYAWNFGDGSQGSGSTVKHSYAKAGKYTVTLTLSDGYKQTAAATTTATITNPAQPPLANAGGPYNGFATQSIAFTSAGSSDPNGLSLSYAWSFGDGATSPVANPSHAYSKPGTYTVNLAVSDSTGLSGSATAMAIISTLGVPTVSIGGPYSGQTGQSIIFNASASTDPNKSPLTYAWSFGDGSESSGATAKHSYAKAGKYAVTLTLTDTYNQTSTATTTATITNPAQPPVANAGGPYTGFSGSAVAFTGAVSTDPNGLALTYAWEFGDGAQGSGVSPSHTYLKAGNYTVKLTVSDSTGLSGSANTTATISTLSAPVANIGGPYTGKTGQSIAFDASASTDPNKSALTFAWNFGDGSQASGAKVTHSYAKAGKYTVTLTLNDTYNQTTTATTTATITNPAQQPIANPGGPYLGTTGQPIAFNGSASTDPNGLSLTYAWDFGDGSTGTGVSPSHSYGTAGTYTVKLTVSDSSGLSASASTNATVTAPTKLTANPGGPYTGIVGTAVQFNGSGSSDPKNETLTYAWDFGDGNQGAGVKPSHAYVQPGAYTVTLSVTNTDKATASATAKANISLALAAVLNGPYQGNVNQVISFDGSASTAPSNDPLTYVWTFGDGATAATSSATHAYTKAGTFNVKLTVTDTVSKAMASATSNAVITQPISVTISSPLQGSLFDGTTVKVTGTVNESGTTVQVNGVAAIVTGSNYAVSNVPLREGVNLITATATDAKGNSGTASTSVTVDMTPPTVSVFLPKDGSTVTTQQIAVTGMVTDIVTGTVNSNDVTVSINGQSATVANRSFQLAGFLLVPGLNTLSVVARDKAGNQSTSVVHVTLSSTAAQQHVVILSGDQQSGVINTVLPQPLVAQLVAANGAPIPNRAITFTVTASDGIIKSLPQQGQTLSLITDANGKASVLFQLGSRAGLGINQVSVTSAGFLGQAVFSASTTVGSAAYIHEFMGNNQRGLLGQPLAEAFQTIVQDAGGNPIANVPVTFKVTGGDGTLGEQTTSTVNTNADGRAQASLTLGQQEGINNYTVSADFVGDPNSPVIFYASGFAQGDPGNTQVSGLVLDNAGTAVPNATVSLQNTNLRTTTDANGRFSISAAPLGTVTLVVDGSTTTLAETLPTLTFVMQSLPGQNNTLNMPVYLPLIDTSNAQTVGGSQPVTLTMTNLPGVSVTIAPNSVTFPDGTHVGQMSLSQVKSDLVPMPPPNGIQPDFAWTLQPAGTKFSVPAQITIPNTKGLPPGQVQEFYQYDHDLEQFVSVGTLRVSPDGSVLTSDPGFGVTKAGWSSPGCNPPPPSCANSCDDNNECTDDIQAGPPDCMCLHASKPPGTACGGTSPGPNNCTKPGMCRGTVCTPSGPGGANGDNCDDGKKCTENDKCQGGVCAGTPIPDQPLNDSKTQPVVQFSATVGSKATVLGNLLSGTLGGGAEASFEIKGKVPSGKISCCEKDNGNMDAVVTLPMTGVGQLVSPAIPIPGASVKVPLFNDTFAGLYGQFKLYLQGDVTVDHNECNKDSGFFGWNLAGGGFKVIGYEDVGVQAVLQGPGSPKAQKILKLAGYIEVGLQGAFTPQSNGLEYNFSFPAVTINATAQLFNGPQMKVQIPYSDPPFNGAPFYGPGTISLPSN